MRRCPLTLYLSLAMPLYLYYICFNTNNGLVKFNPADVKFYLKWLMMSYGQLDRGLPLWGPCTHA